MPIEGAIYFLVLLWFDGKIVSIDTFQFKKLHCAIDTKIISPDKFSVLIEIFFPSSLILSLWSGFSFLLGGIFSF